MFKLFQKDVEEHNYFKEFKVFTLLIIDVADLLIANLKKDSLDSLDEVLNEIQGIKMSANHQKQELLNYLYEDFLPPIERKDIISLTHSLDRVLKNMVDLTFHLDMYQIKTIQPAMHQLMELIEKSVNELPKLMIELEDFKHPQEIRNTLINLNKINIQGNEIYRFGVKTLNLGEMNSFDTMKYTRMYESFDEVFQSIKNLMNIVEAVIIENT